jgi:hypothetical protein
VSKVIRVLKKSRQLDSKTINEVRKNVLHKISLRARHMAIAYRIIAQMDRYCKNAGRFSLRNHVILPLQPPSIRRNLRVNVNEFRWQRETTIELRAICRCSNFSIIVTRSHTLRGVLSHFAYDSESGVVFTCFPRDMFIFNEIPYSRRARILYYATIKF